VAPRGRAALLGLVALAAAACAGGPETADRSLCVGLFREYDRFAQFTPIETFDRRRGRERLDPTLSRLTVLLVQNDCQTRSRDLTGLDAVAAARSGQRIAESGAPLGRLTAVHAGALTDEADAARAVAFFEGLGLRATSIGNRQLGRRVFVGPVATQGGLDATLVAAFEAGFVASYPSQFFRF
jgi:hypothetical protein